MQIESLEARVLLAFSLDVNFQPATAPVVAGYLVDAGEGYGARGGGFTYGWDVANLQTRDRNASNAPSQLHDTLNHMQKDVASRTWEVAVPNGAYSVRVVAGDPSYIDSIYKINVEGITIVSGTPTSSTRWFDGSAVVSVTDGRLTLSNAAGAQNNKIAFIEIAQIETPPPPPPPDAIRVNFQPAGAPVVAGYAVDSGAVFGDRGGGLRYGWNVANSTFMRDRNASLSPDQRHDTLGHLQLDATPRQWEIDLPNGDYSVKLVAGDPSFIDSIYRLNLENVLALSGTPTASARWFTSTSTVTVTDGRLTLSNATGSRNNKIDFIEITALTSSLDAKIANGLAFADGQFRASIAELGTPDRYANNTTSSGTWNIVDARHWTSGFWPGSFWRMYDLTGDLFWKQQAQNWSAALATQPNKTEDVTFRFYVPFGPSYAETGDANLLISAADGKMVQWNNTVGAFRTAWRPSSSGNPAANFGVLLDNIVDAELMYFISRQTGNPAYAQRMTRSVETIINHFVRADGSTMQWGYFNSATGELVSRETYQGHSPESTWSRGQAWAMLGLTIASREAGRADFLAAAKKVSDYFLGHVPADSIPYWDFDAPDIPNTYRDTSAAAIAASSLLQLSKLLGSGSDSERYRAGAVKILDSLLSPQYLAQGTPLHSVLQHGASSVPASTFAPLADSGLIFGDYFLLEAIKLYRSA